MGNKEKTESLQADIVVIGGGGSGLVAAVSAAEAGCKNIIVLEKSGRPGGNTYHGAVGMMAVDSPAQRRLGIKASKDQVFKEAMEAGKWTVDPKLVRAYINKSGDMIGWFESRGMKFKVDSKGPFSGGGRPPIGHGFTVRQNGHKATKNEPDIGPGWVGSTVVEAMLKDCDKYGIKVLTMTKAENLQTDEKGDICGVVAVAKDRVLHIKTKAVIMSAGGFGANKEWLAKYYNIRGNFYTNSLGSLTGDGLKMAAEIDAFDDSNLGHPDFGLGLCHHPWSFSVHRLMTRPDMLLVNKNGERFMDESFMGGLGRQPGQICFAIVDTKTINEIKAKPGFLVGTEWKVEEDEGDIKGTEEDWVTNLDIDLEKESAEGKKTWKADTIEKLAQQIGAAPEILKATVERYNAFCDAGYDSECLKDKIFLKAIRVPPFYAILGRGFIDTTNGGINVNERMEALNKNKKVIKGFYATGDNTGGWVSRNYAHGGTSATWAFCSGFIAGENAAGYVLNGKR